MDDTQIVVNVHRTPQRGTLEENLLLPALVRGGVVVSEEVPLRHAVPFHEYVIFCPYDDLPSTVALVQRNYEYYFERIHGPHSRLPQVLEEMEAEARQELERRLLRPAPAPPVVPVEGPYNTNLSEANIHWRHPYNVPHFAMNRYLADELLFRVHRREEGRGRGGREVGTCGGARPQRLVDGGTVLLEAPLGCG